jgi:hypothetical protein
MVWVAECPGPRKTFESLKLPWSGVHTGGHGLAVPWSGLDLRDRVWERVRVEPIGNETAVPPLVDDRRVDVRGSAACCSADRDLCEDPSPALRNLSDLDRRRLEDRAVALVLIHDLDRRPEPAATGPDVVEIRSEKRAQGRSRLLYASM